MEGLPFSATELAEFRSYQLPSYVMAAVGDALNIGVWLVGLRFLVRPLHALAQRAAAAIAARTTTLVQAPLVRVRHSAFVKLWGGPGGLVALLFAASTLLVARLAYLPLDFYLDYVVQHRHGMSNYTLGAYAVDWLKAMLLTLTATSALALGLFGLARRLPRWWWLVLGVSCGALLAASAALDPYRARLYFEQERLADGALRARIVELLRRADIEFAEVWVERSSRASPHAQAYFAGQGPTRTIVLNDVLVQRFEVEEVLAAVAHEAGHVHQPRGLAQLASALLLIAFLYACHRTLLVVRRRRLFGSTEFADIRALPLLMLLFYVTSVTFRPIGAALARSRERDADAYGLSLTNDPMSFERMLVKATRTNKLDPMPPRWVVLKGARHPPIAERLLAVRAFAKGDRGGR